MGIDQHRHAAYWGQELAKYCPPAMACAPLDLSPLAKWIGRSDRMIWLTNDTDYAVTVGAVTVGAGCRSVVSAEAYCRKYGISGPDSVVSVHIYGSKPAKMYGWPVDQDKEPEPEKSPAEKALDDFIAKRKAKREYPPTQADNSGKAGQATGTSYEEWKREQQERAVGDAMQKLAPHQTNFHDRIVPYRGPVL